MKSLGEYEEKKNLSSIGKRLKNTHKEKTSNPMSRVKRNMIASPNIYSKFSPSSIIKKSPFWNSRKILDVKKNSLNGTTLNFLSTEINTNDKSLNNRHHEILLNQLMIGKLKESNSLNFLSKFSRTSNNCKKTNGDESYLHCDSNSKIDYSDLSIKNINKNSKFKLSIEYKTIQPSNNFIKNINFKDPFSIKTEDESIVLYENVSIKKIPIFRKHRNNLKNLEILNQQNIETQEEENKQNLLPDNKNSGQNTPIDLNTFSMLHKGFYFIDNIKNTNEPKFNFNSLDDDSDDLSEEVTCEGFLYKFTRYDKFKKIYYKLIQKHLYGFKYKNQSQHESMHNISGAFFREGSKIKFEGTDYLYFLIINNNKTRFFYIESSKENEYSNWMKCLKKVTGYSDLNDIYQIGHKLGKGKFGIVRIGVNKKNQKEVAIKILNKSKMTFKDIEMVKTEIEILKICQHPYIIRLYEVYENDEYIYIVMEYCAGGDLFSFIEEREFKISESFAASILHKLSTAIFYLNSYGIVHRDLKPENILMVDKSDKSDIKIVDFGLSKIIGPNELCTESYGTLTYVAPEILLDKPYSKAVDLWSIGIIAYLLLTGCLPFDDENSQREIAYKTISEPLPLPDYLWNDISKEAKDFVSNPDERMNIIQVLEHPWIQKYNKTLLPEIRRRCKDLQQSTFKIYSMTDLN